MARVVYAVIKTETDYRRFPEETIPGGRIPSLRAVEAIPTAEIMLGSSACSGLCLKDREGTPPVAAPCGDPKIAAPYGDLKVASTSACH
jgi:hypothetical protein